MKKLIPLLLLASALRAQQPFPGINITPNSGAAGKINLRNSANVNKMFIQEGTVDGGALGAASVVFKSSQTASTTGFRFESPSGNLAVFCDTLLNGAWELTRIKIIGHSTNSGCTGTTNLDLNTDGTIQTSLGIGFYESSGLGGDAIAIRAPSGGVTATYTINLPGTAPTVAGQALSWVSGSTYAWTLGMTNPLTTTGDIIYSSSGTTAARLGIGTAGQCLLVASGLPSWGSCGAGGGANIQLSNLGTTAINADLLAGTTSLDIGSTGQAFENGFIQYLFSDIYQFQYGGTARGHMGWDNVNGEISITNNLNQRIFAFSPGLSAIAYGNVSPDTTSNSDLGTSSKVWEDGYIESVHSTSVDSTLHTSISGSAHIDMGPTSFDGTNSAGAAAFNVSTSTNGGLFVAADSAGTPAATMYYAGLLIATGKTATITDLSGSGTRPVCATAGGVLTISGCSAGSGTVTSVGQSFTGGLISVSGSPVTTSGTLALTVAGTSGGVPYFASASTWASSAAMTAHGVMIGGGAGAAPTSTSAGTANQVFVSLGASADPQWSNIIVISGNITGNKLEGDASGTNVAFQNVGSTFTVNGNGDVLMSSLTASILSGGGARCLQTNNSGVVTSYATGCVPTSRSISTTSPLGGGGDLSADRTLTCTTCVTGVSGTSPISSSGGTTPAISCSTCITTAGGQSIAGTTTLSTLSVSAAIAGTHNLSGNETVTGNWYGRTFSGGDASCGGVANGWFGFRTDTNEIQMCSGGVLKKVALT